LIILIILGEEYKSRSFSLCNFLHSPVTSSLFGPNILLSTLFSNIHSLCSSLNVRDQVSHPYRTTGKIIVLYSLIFKFFDSRREDYVHKIFYLVTFNSPYIQRNLCNIFQVSLWSLRLKSLNFDN
jgi:hypothetical protein